MSECVSLDLSPHLAGFQRMASTSKKPLVTLWWNEAKICFGGTAKMPGVAGITPPYSGGKGQDSRVATANAKAKVAADIYSMYATPNDAYELLSGTNIPAAKQFWYLHEHNMDRAAAEILHDNTGSIMYPFDGGAYHRKMRRAGRRRGQRFKFFVENPEALVDYVKEVQDRVWWLASGWREPLEALGAKLPAGVKRHSASPGHMPLPIINSQEISISVSNDVKYARALTDMTRRIATVFNVYRLQRLDKMWDDYMEKLSRASGFKRV